MNSAELYSMDLDELRKLNEQVASALFQREGDQYKFKGEKPNAR